MICVHPAIDLKSRSEHWSKFLELGDDVDTNGLVEAAEAAQSLSVGGPIEAYDGLG